MIISFANIQKFIIRKPKVNILFYLSCLILIKYNSSLKVGEEDERERIK